jgi:transposase
MRVAVHLQREVARLHFYDTTQSDRAIGRVLGLHGTTVGSLRAKLQSCRLDWTALKALDDDAWMSELDTKDRSVAQRKKFPDWEFVHAEMQRADATLEQLWREWRELEPNGIGYSQFAQHYRKFRKSRHIVMRQAHVPGQKLYVDFAGRTVEILDSEGGPSIKAQIFVAVMGYSNFTYLEATASQTTNDWNKCHINCFAALGAVPHWVVCDNLKAAVIRRERDRTVINPNYHECLKHYDTAALPAGPRKPKHKAKVEVGVQIAQRWILFRLRNRTFFSLAELNAELTAFCTQLNDHAFKKLPGCRRERFEMTERAAMKSLPAAAFEPCDWRYNVLAGPDYHIEHNRCFYSVPYRFAGERLDLRTTSSIVEMFHKGRRVALHAFLTTPGTVTTVPEHRPIVHSRILEGEPKSLTAWAKTVGPNAERMIKYHLEDRRDMTNGLKAAKKMRHLADLHGSQRFEEVCAYALPLNLLTLRTVSSIFAQSPDKRADRVMPALPSEPVIVHGNLRGPEYFGETA